MLALPRLIDPGRMRVLRPTLWAGRLDKIMATRKRHSPEQIVRKLMAADRLLAEGRDTAAVSRELGVSEATYHRWRNQFGGLKARGAAGLDHPSRGSSIGSSTLRASATIVSSSSSVIVPSRVRRSEIASRASTSAAWSTSAGAARPARTSVRSR
jgi:putative transposase